MWQEIGLVGRDRLLAREIFPRIRGKGRFFITGQRGIGKTAVLEWAYQNTLGTKALVSAALTPRDFLIELCLQLKIEPNLGEHELSIERKLSRMTRQSLEKLLIQADVKGNIFIDELERMKPTMIKILPFLIRQHCVFLAGVPPFRDEVRKFLWGAVEITLTRLDRKSSFRIAEKASQKIGKMVDFEAIVNASEGIPGKLIQMALGEVEWKRPTRMKEEEVNIAPVLLLVISVAIFFRYISIGMDSLDFYILSGLGIGLTVFLRFFIYQMARRK